MCIASIMFTQARGQLHLKHFLISSIVCLITCAQTHNCIIIIIICLKQIGGSNFKNESQAY